ncbi:hypothetical protein EDD29_0569 [Actinocorallia herbida]|uniref:DivIVA domain-containing protein n=1 Tax=Actinocorallia herbida TaxID=58109 RepID=A0A3N1CP21_9ACTN|nr:hypothetical protein [Actinocorallia herbida]ROO83079.1 hypothetical protein EDD29_0569 [Actinocorallia herbida]
MPVVLLLAALAVVAATVVLALGRGGELAEPADDNPPSGIPDDRLPRSADAVLLRLPKSPWGYTVPVADDALGKLTQALAVREEQVARLERELALLREEARKAPEDAAPGETDLAEFGGAPGSTALEPWEFVGPSQGTPGEAGRWAKQEEPWTSGEPEWRWEEQQRNQ